MSYVDVFSKYYAFAKLPRDNKYYPLKKDNYELVTEQYRKNCIELHTFPIRATIQTTERCNLDCIMCQLRTERRNSKVGSMRKQDFDIIVKRLFPYIVEIHPTNIGEPLISKWFGYFCDRVVEYGVLLDITTNGMLLNEETIYKILPNLLDIKISFDGVKKETFERIRVKADFNLICKNIGNLLKIREKENSQGTVTLQMTLFDFNYMELLDVIRFAHDRNIDRVKAYHVFSYSKQIDKYSLINNPQKFEETRISAIRLAQNLGVGLEISEPDNCGDGTDGLIPQKCRLPYSECWIERDGQVRPCHSYGDVGFGNIYSADFYSILNSDNAKHLRKSLVDTDIKSICTEKGLCGMNFIKRDENQPVPYDRAGYLYDSDAAQESVKWSGRSKQFQLRRKYV